MLFLCNNINIDLEKNILIKILINLIHRVIANIDCQ